MNKNKLLFFMHIPKTGGTTLTSIMMRNFYCTQCLVLTGDENKNIELWQKISTERKKSIKYITGHFLYGVHHLTNMPHTYITLLRNPLDLFISVYAYLKKEYGKFYSIEEYPKVYRNNAQIKRILGIRPEANLRLTSTHIKRAQTRIKKNFLCVGLTEHFNETVFYIKNILGLDNVFYRRERESPDRPVANELSEKIIKCVRKNNRYDWDLYEWWSEEFQKKINKFLEKYRDEYNDFILKLAKFNTFADRFNKFTEVYFSNLIHFAWKQQQLRNKTFKCIIWGADKSGQKAVRFMKEAKKKKILQPEIIGLVDNDKKKQSTKMNGYNIFRPTKKLLRKVDYIIIASHWKNNIFRQLLELGVEPEAIVWAGDPLRPNLEDNAG